MCNHRSACLRDQPLYGEPMSGQQDERSSKHLREFLGSWLSARSGSSTQLDCFFTAAADGVLCR
jgi:hypothetical protein